MRTRLLSFLIAANLAAGGILAVATPAAAGEESIRDCCKNSVEGTGFCCDNCCWFTSDCNQSADCGDKQVT